MPVQQQREGVYALASADVAAASAELTDLGTAIAVTQSGNPIVWRPETDLWPHLLLDGPLGSGKTLTAHNIVVAAAQAGWQIHILRQFDREYRDFLGWPCAGVATTPAEHRQMLHRSRAMMQGQDRAPLLVVIDTVTGVWDGLDSTARQDLLRILLDGRTHRAHLVLVTDPTATEPVPADMKGLVGISLSLLPPSSVHRRSQPGSSNVISAHHGIEFR
ncbi:hypothetical protein EB73_02385 [Mycobacterium sp. SWH-M3]|nr:hypothetical protein EB73_02385 [Mycobacterium sp. SWH-M3]